MGDLNEYETTTRTFPDWTPHVVDTFTVGDVSVDVVQHTGFAHDPTTGETTGTNRGFEAVRAGSGYTLHDPEVRFYVRAGEHHAAGAYAGGSYSHITGTESLGRSTSIGGVWTAARRNLANAALIEQYGPAARAAVCTWSDSDFTRLPTDAVIEPGDTVVGWGHHNYRQGIAVKVTKAKVYFLFSTPSGAGHLTSGSGKPGTDVRLAAKTAPGGKAAALALVADLVKAGAVQATVVDPKNYLTPPGTPEYEAYERELKEELAKWSTGADPYQFPMGQYLDGCLAYPGVEHHHPGKTSMVEALRSDLVFVAAVAHHETYPARGTWIVDDDEQQAQAERLVDLGWLRTDGDLGFAVTDAGLGAIIAWLHPGDAVPWAIGFVKVGCGHTIAQSEWDAGFTTCERCAATAAEPVNDVAPAVTKPSRLGRPDMPVIWLEDESGKYSDVPDGKVAEQLKQIMRLGRATGVNIDTEDAPISIFVDVSTASAMLDTLLAKLDERRRTLLHPQPPVPYLRPNEALVKIVDFDAGVCSFPDCGKQLVEGWFMWTGNRSTFTSAGGEVRDASFPSYRHADGSASHQTSTGQDDYFAGPKPRCEQCKAPDPTVQDTGYGWRTTCNRCGWSHYTDSGD